MSVVSITRLHCVDTDARGVARYDCDAVGPDGTRYYGLRAIARAGRVMRLESVPRYRRGRPFARSVEFAAITYAAFVKAIEQMLGNTSAA